MAKTPDPSGYVTKIDPKLTPDSGRIAISSPKPEKEPEAS
jgi:hypothetical protein